MRPRAHAPLELPATDPRMIMVTAAGALAAIEAYHRNGWRRAPAQCPICLKAIRGASHAEIIALLAAWNGAYHRRLLALQAQAMVVVRE